MKEINKIIRNILRTKVNHYDHIDDDELFIYCINRGFDYMAIKNELEARGYNLI